MKAYKTVIYSFLIGGVLALVAQSLVTVWTNVLTGTPMQFFIGGSTLISMGIIGCILGGFANYQLVEEWGTFGALLPFSGFAMAVGMKMVGPWTKQNATAGKAVSAAILEKDIPLCSQFSLPAPLPEGTFAGESGPLGVFIGWRTKEHFARTLRLIPRVLRVGIGCRRGISAEAVVHAVQTVFAENGLDTAAICGVCSTDLKQDEAGLLAACEKNNWPVHFYTAQQLRDVAGDFTPSDFVRSVTGVDNVCERAALLDAEKLIVQKTARDGVTVAVAAEHWEVRFG